MTAAPAKVWLSFSTVLDDPRNYAVLARLKPKELHEILFVLRNRPVTDRKDDAVLAVLRARLNKDFHMVERNLGRVSKHRVIHELVEFYQDQDLLELVLELGINLDVPARRKGTWGARPIAYAYDRSNLSAAECLVNSGILEQTRVRCPKRIKPLDGEDPVSLQDHIRLRIANLCMEYTKEGPKNLARLLVEGLYYAIYHRMRNPKIPMTVMELLKEHNGKTFLELCPYFPNFRGAEEIKYRFGIDVPDVAQVNFYKFPVNSDIVRRRFSVEKRRFLHHRKELERKLLAVENRSEKQTAKYAKLRSHLNKLLPALLRRVPSTSSLASIMGK